jgi:hypothetical protein
MQGVAGYLAFRDRMAKAGLMKPVPEERKAELMSREDRTWAARYQGQLSVRKIFENYHQTMVAKFPLAPNGQNKNPRVLASAKIHELRLTVSSDKEVDS